MLYVLMRYDEDITGYGPLTRLNRKMPKVNYHRRRRWLDNVYLEGTLLLVSDQF